MFGPSLLLAQAAEVAETADSHTGGLIGLLLFSIAALLALILYFRLQPFVALIIASIIVAVGAPMVTGDPIIWVDVKDGEGNLVERGIASTMTHGMGNALGFIATIIGLGAIFGQILEHSGGAKALANTLVRLFGEKRGAWAMTVTGFLLSIPVFLDVGLVIVAPIIYALAKHTKKSLLLYGLPLVAGMAVTHAFVPPTPGPVAVSEILEADLGKVIILGLICGLPTAIIAGPLLTPFLIKNVKVRIPEFFEEREEHEQLPNFGLVFAIMAFPIVLIILGSTWAKVDDPSLAQQVIGFLGHPVIALLLATLMSLIFLGTMRGVPKDKLLELSTKALGPAGIIILITGAGGVFKQVLGSSGVGQALGDALSKYDLSVLVVAYLISMFIRVAQGSATVAMLTAAGLVGALVSSAGLTDWDLALVVIAIAAGSTMLSHVNDSGFWIISRYLGMTEAQTLKTWTIASVVISLVGFGFTLLLSVFVG